MKSIKKHPKARRLGILVLAAAGALVVTVSVFAGEDNQPHGINSHIHRNDTNNEGVEWIVEVGRLEWHNFSTFCWHKVFAKNTTSKSVTGEWEWKHYVKNNTSTWDKTDKILDRINFQSRGEGKQELTRSGWTSIDFPGAGTYRIDAYTRVGMVKEGRDITGNAGKRSILSVWFNVM